MILSSHPKAARTGQYAAMFVYMLFLAFPLLWLLSLSFKGARELYALHPSLVPHQPTLDSYRVAFTENGLPHAAFQSFKIATRQAKARAAAAVLLDAALTRSTAAAGQ